MPVDALRALRRSRSLAGGDRAAAGDRGRLRQLRHALLAGLGPAARPRRDAQLQACRSRRRRIRCSSCSASSSRRSAPSATLAIVVALAYLALASLGYLVYRLGARWFSWPVGLAAAALVLSRYEVLSYGVRAYVDIPYVALVLAALRARDAPPARRLAGDRAARPRRPAAPRGVAVRRRLLALPVARRRRPRERAALAALVALAPVLWALSDLAVTGNPLWSLTNTRSTAQHAEAPDRAGQRPLLRRAAARRGARARRPGRRARSAAALALWLTRSRAAARRRRRGARARRVRARRRRRACRSRTATCS